MKANIFIIIICCCFIFSCKHKIKHPEFTAKLYEPYVGGTIVYSNKISYNKVKEEIIIFCNYNKYSSFKIISTYLEKKKNKKVNFKCENDSNND